MTNHTIDDLATACEAIARHDGIHETALPGMWVYRSSVPSEGAHSVYEPALCIIARGRKQVRLGAQTFFYDPAHYLLVSVDLPITGCVTEAPYLGLKMTLKPAVIAEVMTQAGTAHDADCPDPGLAVSPLPGPLLDAVLRLLQLQSADVPILAPLVQREIVYHLLRGPQAGQLQRMVTGDRGRGVVAAIRWLRDNYTEPLRVEHMARQVHMSASGLHHQFKAITAMSPLQYQKRLRLQEARRLLLTETVDAATVSYQVGYNSPSQFSREYSRLFGAPPQRDIARLLQGDLATAQA